MKHLSRFILAIGLLLISCGFYSRQHASTWNDLAAQPASETKTDFTKPESPMLPMPKGMKFVDQGKFDPRLKGYRTPEGFKVEIVADAPTIINPVGMRFGPDGTLFVLEWTPDSNTWPEHRRNSLTRMAPPVRSPP